LPARNRAPRRPAAIGRAFFEEIANAVSGSGKPDPARLIMLRHGLVPA
jgi:hypothetical protein